MDRHGARKEHANVYWVLLAFQQMLGTQGNPDWLDVSDYVVHFTKGGEQVGYETIMAILWQRRLVRGPGMFGAARFMELAQSQRAVCFSEVPLGFLGRLAARRQSRYGLAFAKRFVLSRGGAPVWYLEHGTPQQQALENLVTERRRAGFAPGDPLWRLTPFVDFPSGPGSPYQYAFQWEREWRVTDDFCFTESNVALLLIPEHQHGVARQFFADATHQNIGPGYFCPYVDPVWPLARVQQALAHHGHGP
jgi:hypothetical protein